MCVRLCKREGKQGIVSAAYVCVQERQRLQKKLISAHRWQDHMPTGAAAKATADSLVTPSVVHKCECVCV